MNSYYNETTYMNIINKTKYIMKYLQHYCKFYTYPSYMKMKNLLSINNIKQNRMSYIIILIYKYYFIN